MNDGIEPREGIHFRARVHEPKGDRSIIAVSFNILGQEMVYYADVEKLKAMKAEQDGREAREAEARRFSRDENSTKK